MEHFAAKMVWCSQVSLGEPFLMPPLEERVSTLAEVTWASSSCIGQICHAYNTNHYERELLPGHFGERIPVP
jgi:hypothetical protein